MKGHHERDVKSVFENDGRICRKPLVGMYYIYVFSQLFIEINDVLGFGLHLQRSCDIITEYACHRVSFDGVNNSVDVDA